MSKEKQDKHFPVWGLDNFIRRLTDNPNKYCSYVAKGQVVADLGCGPGYYTLPLAESVGPEGKVYAIDSDEKSIQALEKKASRHGYHNIEAHATSASDLSFIEDGSVDFVLVCDLFCSIAPRYRDLAVNEIKRIVKPSGRAYVSAALGAVLGVWGSNIGRADWEKMLDGFRVKRRGEDWAVVSTV